MSNCVSIVSCSIPLLAVSLRSRLAVGTESNRKRCAHNLKLQLTSLHAPVLRLRVHGGVPVGVVEDDCVCAGEVDADAAGARREDEDEVLLVAVEALHERLALLHLGRPVESEGG